MSLVIDVTVHDGATQMVDGVRMAIRGVPIHQEIAAEALMIVQERFRGLASSQQNVLKHTGFWDRMLAGTVPMADEDSATIRMPREVAQRYFGGTILPRDGRKNLAIPARSEAVGLSPLSFSELRFILFTRTGSMALVQKTDTHVQVSKGKRKGQFSAARKGQEGTHGAGLVMYWLVPSVTQAADPNVLPSDAEFQAAASRGARNYLEQFGRAA